MDYASDFEDKVLEHKERGNQLYKEQKYEEAIQEYKKAVRYTNSAIVQCNLATAYLKLKDYEHALESCLTSIGDNPLYCKAFIRRGEVYMALKRYYEATHSFELAINLESDNSVAIQGYTDAQQKLEEFEEEHGMDHPSRPPTIPGIPDIIFDYIDIAYARRLDTQFQNLKFGYYLEYTGPLRQFIKNMPSSRKESIFREVQLVVKKPPKMIYSFVSKMFMSEKVELIDFVESLAFSHMEFKCGGSLTLAYFDKNLRTNCPEIAKKTLPWINAYSRIQEEMVRDPSYYVPEDDFENTKGHVNIADYLSSNVATMYSAIFKIATSKGNKNQLKVEGCPECLTFSDCESLCFRTPLHPADATRLISEVVEPKAPKKGTPVWMVTTKTMEAFRRLARDPVEGPRLVQKGCPQAERFYKFLQEKGSLWDIERKAWILTVALSHYEGSKELHGENIALKFEDFLIKQILGTKLYENPGSEQVYKARLKELDEAHPFELELAYARAYANLVRGKPWAAIRLMKKETVLRRLMMDLLALAFDYRDGKTPKFTSETVDTSEGVNQTSLLLEYLRAFHGVARFTSLKEIINSSGLQSLIKVLASTSIPALSIPELANIILLMLQTKKCPHGKPVEFNDPKAIPVLEKLICDYCHKESQFKLKVCGGCHKVRYCSRECQQTAWATHKLVCKSEPNGTKDENTKNQ